MLLHMRIGRRNNRQALIAQFSPKQSTVGSLSCLHGVSTRVSAFLGLQVGQLFEVGLEEGKDYS